MDLAKKYLTTNFAEHNPNMESGLTNFQKAMGAQPPAMLKALESRASRLVRSRRLCGAGMAAPRPDPASPGKTYYWNSFDVLRMQNGKIAEHWDSDSGSAAGRQVRSRERKETTT